jgi:endonuclease YncB( thermonuclease family)
MRPVLFRQRADAQPTLATVAIVMNADFMPMPMAVKCRQRSVAARRSQGSGPLPTPTATRRRAPRGRAGAALLMALALQAGAGAAAAGGCGDAPAVSVAGLSAIDGDTFRTVDGQQWRLAGVMAPKRGDGARPSPLAGDAPARSGNRPRSSPADAARIALDTLIAHQPLWLEPVGNTVDRYERRLAVARDAAGCGSLAERLLAAGHARVYPTFATRALAPALYIVETAARAEQRGLWADARYRVLAAREVGARFDSYVVVEGRPVEATRQRDGTLVLFGRDRRRDFGVTIAARLRKLMQAAGLDPGSLVGRHVRVRGWLRNRMGAPGIELAVPEQLEVIAP